MERAPFTLHARKITLNPFTFLHPPDEYSLPELIPYLFPITLNLTQMKDEG